MAIVTVAASVGNFLDYFEWFVSASASALVWPAVFFPHATPAIALLSSIFALVLGFLLRPVGAFIFGHVGDRRGRKTTLVWTLVLMGIGTLGIALTPGYAAIGIYAIVLLFVFRLIQGIGIGGEFGGAATWVTEVAEKSKWRTFFASWINATSNGGNFAAAIAFAALIASMPSSDFLNYGWRIPFYIGFVIALVGFVIRYKTMESPIFQQLRQQIQQKRATARAPAVVLLTKHWRQLLIVAGMHLVNGAGTYTFIFATGFIQPAYGVSRGVAAFGATLGTLASVIAVIIGGLLANPIGRKRLIFISQTLVLIIAVPVFGLLFKTADTILIYIAFILLGTMQNIAFAIYPSYYPEQFPTAVRYSGSGLGYQLGSTIGASAAPLIASSLFVIYGNAAGASIGLMLMVFSFISMLATLMSKELPKGSSLQF